MRVADHVVEEDLRWFWGLAEGEMGGPSNFAPMVAQLECGGRTGGAPILDLADHRLEAAERYRGIVRALERLSEADVRMLRHAFGPDAHCLRGLDRPACVASVTPLSPAAVGAYQSSHSTKPFLAWLVSLFARSSSPTAAALDRFLAKTIALEADQLLGAALCAYAAARADLRRVQSFLRASRRASWAPEASRRAWRSDEKKEGGGLP